MESILIFYTQLLNIFAKVPIFRQFTETKRKNFQIWNVLSRFFFDFFRHQWTFSLCTCQEIPFQSFRLQWWLWWWLDQSKLCSTLIQLSKLWITLVEVRRLFTNSAVCLQFLCNVDLELFPYTVWKNEKFPVMQFFFCQVDLEFFSKNRFHEIFAIFQQNFCRPNSFTNELISRKNLRFLFFTLWRNESFTHTWKVFCEKFIG